MSVTASAAAENKADEQVATAKAEVAQRTEIALLANNVMGRLVTTTRQLDIAVVKIDELHELGSLEIRRMTWEHIVSNFKDHASLNSEAYLSLQRSGTRK